MKRVESWKPKWLEADEIERQVELIRSRFGYKSVPVNVELLAERDLKITIIPTPRLRAVINSDAYLSSSLDTIRVDQKYSMDDRYYRRYRFTIAHELGHYFLHHKQWSSLDFDSAEEYISFVLSDGYQAGYSSFEWQANTFAGFLLVPTTELREAVQREKLAQRVPEMNKSIASRTATMLQIAPAIANYFNVSEDVITRRIRDEELC